MKYYVCRTWIKIGCCWRPVGLYNFETIGEAREFGRLYVDQRKADDKERDFDVFMRERKS